MSIKVIQAVELEYYKRALKELYGKEQANRCIKYEFPCVQCMDDYGYCPIGNKLCKEADLINIDGNTVFLYKKVNDEEAIRKC